MFSTVLTINWNGIECKADNCIFSVIIKYENGLKNRTEQQ